MYPRLQAKRSGRRIQPRYRETFQPPNKGFNTKNNQCFHVLTRPLALYSIRWLCNCHMVSHDTAGIEQPARNSEKGVYEVVQLKTVL